MQNPESNAMVQEAVADAAQEEGRKNRGCADGCADWFRSDRGDAAGWAAILIWGGLVLLAEATSFAANFAWWDGWAVFFAGAGAIVLLEALVRLSIPAHRRRVAGLVIVGLVLLGIGLGDRIDWNWVWPVLLIAIGLATLRGAVARES